MSLVRINKSVNFQELAPRWCCNCSTVPRKSQRRVAIFAQHQGRGDAVNLKPDTSPECRKKGERGAGKVFDVLLNPD